MYNCNEKFYVKQKGEFAKDSAAIAAVTKAEQRPLKNVRESVRT